MFLECSSSARRMSCDMLPKMEGHRLIPSLLLASVSVHKVYLLYVRSAGVVVTVITLLSLCLMQASAAGFSYWLSFWASKQASGKITQRTSFHQSRRSDGERVGEEGRGGYTQPRTTPQLPVKMKTTGKYIGRAL